MKVDPLNYQWLLKWRFELIVLDVSHGSNREAVLCCFLTAPPDSSESSPSTCHCQLPGYRPGDAPPTHTHTLIL